MSGVACQRDLAVVIVPWLRMPNPQLVSRYFDVIRQSVHHALIWLRPAFRFSPQSIDAVVRVLLVLLCLHGPGGQEIVEPRFRFL